DMEAVRREVPGVSEVAATHDLQMTVVAGGVERPVTLVAVTEGFQNLRHLLVLKGRYFDADDTQTYSKVCLLTEDLARIVFSGSDAVGQDIRIGELRFTVIGVFKERIATFGQSEIARESLIVPFGLLKSYAGTDAVKVLYAQAPRPEAVPAVMRGGVEVLPRPPRAGRRYKLQKLRGAPSAAAEGLV